MPSAIQNEFCQLELKLMDVGDINSMEKGSGARMNGGKPDFSLIPLHLLEPVARVMEIGAKKYAAWNWAKGMAWSIPIACIIRHMAKYMRGETLDKESGESHMAHVIANAMMLLHYENAFIEGDDRPKTWFNDDL